MQHSKNKPNHFVYKGRLYEGVPRYKVVGLTGFRNECPTCDELFNSIYAFEAHRVGEIGVDRRCLGVEGMLEKGMAKNADGFWVSKPYKEWK